MLWSSSLCIYGDSLQEAASARSDEYSLKFSESKLSSKILTKLKKKVGYMNMYNTKIICPHSGIDDDLTNEAFKELQDNDRLERSAHVLRKKTSKYENN